mmetsp:Transcript_748/g.2415  ORF Transcript_748/g.2415 Transcript_748/m.2415 type:complete len:231 (+) Transcript_748:302-994(+)
MNSTPISFAMSLLAVFWTKERAPSRMFCLSASLPLSSSSSASASASSVSAFTLSSSWTRAGVAIALSSRSCSASWASSASAASEASESRALLASSTALFTSALFMSSTFRTTAASAAASFTSSRLLTWTSVTSSVSATFVSAVSMPTALSASAAASSASLRSPETSLTSLIECVWTKETCSEALAARNCERGGTWEAPVWPRRVTPTTTAPRTLDMAVMAIVCESFRPGF